MNFFFKMRESKDVHGVNLTLKIIRITRENNARFDLIRLTFRNKTEPRQIKQI